MKKLLILAAWILNSSLLIADNLKEENRFIGFLHQLQYVETVEDVIKLIPDCPPAQPDAGDDNSEIKVKTKLFGCDAEGEFNFHKGVLVSHGFELVFDDYADGHNAFLDACKILDSKVKGFESSVALPIDKGDTDCDGRPADRMTIYLHGIHLNASYQLRLNLLSGSGSFILGWGAQKVHPSEKSKIEQAGTGQPATRPESKSESGDKPQPEAEGRSR
jgi:hypothetical protein